MAIKIVVDSSSDIPQELSSKLGIITVPMPVNISGNTYLEGVDIFPERFYADFPHYKELPKTSQPNPADLKEVYEQILADGFDVLAIHLSSGLSSTYQSAVMVREMCSTPARIHVLDSLGASFGFGLQAVLDSQILQGVEDTEEILKRVVAIRDKMRYIFTLDTLEYLVKGGRVSKTAGFVGGLLDVKPILHMTAGEGKIEVFGKIRSRKGAIRKLVEIMAQEAKAPAEQVVGISHAACLEDARYLAAEIKNRLKVKDVIISDIGCVVGSHVGPGTLALFYLR
jgi:DegV family protein with EDD domain